MAELLKRSGAVTTVFLFQDNQLPRVLGIRKDPRLLERPSHALGAFFGEGAMLRSAIDRHLRSRPRPPRQTGVFHCSDLHRQVGRLVVLYLKGPTEHFKPRLHRIFDCGFALQARLTGYFSEMGMLIGQDVPVEDVIIEKAEIVE